MSTALAELRDLLWGTRLLTLAGPGGAGKSRLAVALGEAVRADFIGGAWWADLTASVEDEPRAPGGGGRDPPRRHGRQRRRRRSPSS